MGDRSNPFQSEIIELWRTSASSDAAYFDKAESEEWLSAIWRPDSVFQRRLRELDLAATAEIACGRGRHAIRLVDRCEVLYLVDTSSAAIEAARERFKKHSNVHLILSEDGQSIPAPSGALTAVYSFDAIVHFEPITVAAYLQEIGRVLKSGGRALIHHSNYAGNPTGKIADVHGWRNYMTPDLFAHFASRAELDVLSCDILEWSFIASDALTLLVRR